MAASAKSSGSSSNHPEKLSEKLLKLMENENRPFAINEIHERIGKQFDKSMLEKCLQKHVHGNRIMERTNGKQKIFCFNNNLNKINIETQRGELRALDDKMRKYTKSISEKQERIKRIESQFKAHEIQVPLAILQSNHDALTDSVNKLQSRADEMRKRDGPTLDPKEFTQLQLKCDKSLQEFQKRKRLCLNLIDGIMEGYPKSKHKLIEDSAIETDEAAGFDINQYK